MYLSELVDFIIKKDKVLVLREFKNMYCAQGYQQNGKSELNGQKRNGMIELKLGKLRLTCSRGCIEGHMCCF